MMSSDDIVQLLEDEKCKVEKHQRPVEKFTKSGRSLYRLNFLMDVERGIDCLYMIKKGIVGLGKEHDNEKNCYIEYLTLRKGDFIGELEMPIRFNEKVYFNITSGPWKAWCSSDAISLRGFYVFDDAAGKFRDHWLKFEVHNNYLYFPEEGVEMIKVDSQKLSKLLAKNNGLRDYFLTKVFEKQRMFPGEWPKSIKTNWTDNFVNLVLKRYYTQVGIKLSSPGDPSFTTVFRKDGLMNNFGHSRSKSNYISRKDQTAQNKADTNILEAELEDKYQFQCSGNAKIEDVINEHYALRTIHNEKITKVLNDINSLKANQEIAKDASDRKKIQSQLIDLQDTLKENTQEYNREVSRKLNIPYPVQKDKRRPSEFIIINHDDLDAMFARTLK